MALLEPLRALPDLVLLALHSMVLGWISSAVRFVLRAATLLLLHEREYTEGQGTTSASYDAVCHITSTRAWFATRMASRGGARLTPGGFVVGRRAAFFAATRTTDSGRLLCSRLNSIAVWRWRWLPPLVPDDACAEAKSDGSIAVMRQCSPSASQAEWRVRAEVACPACVPAPVADASREVAALVCSALLAQPQGARQARVLVCGPPGCGKSTSARLLADRLHVETGGGSVTLVAGFDPTRPGHSLANVLQRAVADGGASSWVVVAMEEVDCVLRALDQAAGAVAGAGQQGVLPDVHDKQSWTTMLDMLQFVDRAVLVMTTNLSHAELDALDETRHRGALLRAGRITMRVAMTAEGRVEVLGGA